MACAVAYADAFQARDLAAMDAQLHFPHLISADGDAVLWPCPGQLPASYFEDLERRSGWSPCRFIWKEARAVSDLEVELRLETTLLRSGGTDVLHTECQWILTFENDRWGIRMLAY